MTQERAIVSESYLLSGYEGGVKTVSFSLGLEALSATFLTYSPIGDLWIGGQLWFFIEQLVRLTF